MPWLKIDIIEALNSEGNKARFELIGLKISWSI
jgi:hypothetical protein